MLPGNSCHHEDLAMCRLITNFQLENAQSTPVSSASVKKACIKKEMKKIKKWALPIQKNKEWVDHGQPSWVTHG